jgi:hypothetical protein
MNDLVLIEHRDFIESLISKHVVARLEFVQSKEDIGGKLGRALWDSPYGSALIQLPQRITAQEIDDSLLALAVRGQVTGNSELVRHADEIDTSIKYLQHLVLHEVAHIKNDWRQDRETDCDLWVYGQMHEET